MELRTGNFAISKAGHDKGRVYVVCGFTPDRTLLTDGESHPAGAPKKKNPRHLQPVGAGIEEGLIESLKAGEISDERIRKAIKDWKNKDKGGF